MIIIVYFVINHFYVRYFKGKIQESLALTFRLGRSTISKIVKKVTIAIFIVLKEEFLRFLYTENEWRVISHNFGEQWNFHHIIGAMDGKHCVIDLPLQSGSMFYNYKSDYSVVLLALVDAQLRFIYVNVNVRTNGRVSDSGIWNKCFLKNHLDRNALHIPPPAPLPDTQENFPFVIIGGEGFPLSEKLLIPYPGPQCSGIINRRIFNYRYEDYLYYFFKFLVNN